MGLGANTIVNRKKEAAISNKDQGEDLLLIKGAFAKIIAGKHIGNYCEVLLIKLSIESVIIVSYPAMFF